MALKGSDLGTMPGLPAVGAVTSFFVIEAQARGDLHCHSFASPPPGAPVIFITTRRDRAMLSTACADTAVEGDAMWMSDIEEVD